jgi:hypothetical protein
MKIISWNCKVISPYDREGFTEKRLAILKNITQIFMLYRNVQLMILKNLEILKSKVHGMAII